MLNTDIEMPGTDIEMPGTAIEMLETAILAHLGASGPGYPPQNDEIMAVFAATAERKTRAVIGVRPSFFVPRRACARRTIHERSDRRL